MKNICFYFEIHQPLRLKRYRFFEIGQDHYYYDDFQNEERIRFLVDQAYLPSNKVITELIRSSNGNFRCAFSISGIALEQFEQSQQRRGNRRLLRPSNKTGTGNSRPFISSRDVGSARSQSQFF